MDRRIFYMYVPDEGSLLPKYRDSTTSNDFELYIYRYIYTYRQYTTEEGHMSVRKPWSFYWIKVSQLRFIFVFNIYIYIYIHRVKVE